MARYILIDRCSGYIFGDTADIDGKSLYLHLGSDDDSLITACRALDESIGARDRSYEVLGYSNPSLLASNEGGYLLYRADINGSEAVPVVWDGQDQETIEAVETNCHLCGVVRVTEAASESDPSVGGKLKIDPAA